MTTFWKCFGAVAIGAAFAACSDGASQGFSATTSDAGSADAQVDGASSFGEGDASSPPFSAFEQGELAVEGRGCASCHQSTNPSDGVMSGQMTPVPGTTAFGA